MLELKECSAPLQVILAGLRCAQLLASSHLVHRDLRLANFFWDEHGPFVGDLELAAKAPLKVPLQLCLLVWPVLQLKTWCGCTIGVGNQHTSTDRLD